MKLWLLDLLECPTYRDARLLLLTAESSEGDDVLAGALQCQGCAAVYPVRGGIPRFVPADNYAHAFGWQWNRWRDLQIDRMAGHQLSDRRFFADSRWSRDWIKGKLILDAGCGAGRFTDAAAQAGARVVAVDLSSAIDACRLTALDPRGRSAQRGEVAHVQGNLLQLPFRAGVFDGVFCMGVIQHTPDPRLVMQSLPRYAKAGAPIAYNFYESSAMRDLQLVKYALRRFTPSWSESTLLRFCRLLTMIFFPFSLVMSRIPVVRFFVMFFPVCATHDRELTIGQQFEWTVLDTFDWYNPHYEINQRHEQVEDLLRETDVMDISSAPGLAWARKA